LSFTPQADSLKPVKYRWEKIRSAFTGKPVDSRQVAAMSLPKRFALPLFGSDGISSVAYAADEIILMLAVAGNAAIVYAPWVGLAVAVVGLMIVGTYRYNIKAGRCAAAAARRRAPPPRRYFGSLGTS